MNRLGTYTAWFVVGALCVCIALGVIELGKLVLG
jgi:hypothetical protein